MLEELPTHVTNLLVIFARLGAVLMLLPAFSDTAVPGQIRLLIAFGFSIAMYGLLGPQLPVLGSGVDLGLIVISEMLIGLALGMIIKIMFLAITVAGSIISLQVGLTSAVVPDPTMGGQIPVMAKFVGIAAIVICFALNIHHLWIAAMVNSYNAFQVGALPPAQDFAELAVTTASRSMALGVSLAAPLIVYGIVFNVALGLSARLAPTIQVFFIAQPLNILLGLSLTATIIGAVLMTFGNEMAAWMQSGWT
ncbi:flagellar biosynthetic protein FliR [Erythrobacter aureus]|uniref:Flagellar biosynthetic protein FliR n=1 Tax=Erythrobacter aureus TaxID=2182384 RepID=A0A345YIE4_9SPHN|nr:flagellar biosynthetic protein FliR [Erythrobacter aureus]AXK43696.1 flagellar biosynthetic protein FliR [Erythrobacter aureus]